MHELTHDAVAAPLLNARILQGSDKIGAGKMVGPEDLLYDSGSGVLYTGCADGWIKRVSVNDSAQDSVVEDWVNTGGRPLGLARGLHGEIIVADADKVRYFKYILSVSTVSSVFHAFLAGSIR